MITKNGLEGFWLRRRLECLEEIEKADESGRADRAEEIRAEYRDVITPGKLITILREIDSDDEPRPFQQR
jgi:hypothetical protein